MVAVARAATTSDAFNAIAELQRREILVLLQGCERPVTELARDLAMSQPQASKHLRVLREVGLVRVRGAGKQRLYGLDASGLRPVHEWLGGFGVTRRPRSLLGPRPGQEPACGQSTTAPVTGLQAPVPRAGSGRDRRPSRWTPQNGSCHNHE
jgi:DNA-binding transcriptional ArsR family regulator